MNPLARFFDSMRYVALLGALVAMLSACGGEEAGDDRTADSTQADSTESAGGPSVTVGADKTHAVQPGDEITVTVTVDGFSLDAAKTGEPNVGHYRVYLDDASGDDFLAESAMETVKVTVPDDVTDGSHQLRVVLYNNDSTPLDPPAQGDVWLIIYRL